MVTFFLLGCSEDELLSTRPSPSPLPLLSSNFGVEAACSLHELKASEGEFKLSGYLSGPFGILSLKVLHFRLLFLKTLKCYIF